MPDNVTLDNNTTTGETIRTVRKASVQYPVSILDVGTHPDDNTGSSNLVSKANNVGLPVEGLSDSGTVSSGAPVLVGAKFLSTIPTLTNTHAATLLVDSRNNLRTTIVGKNTDNGIAIDGNGAISVAGVATFDYDTGAGTDDTTCVGIAVPASGGAAAVKSTSIQNTVAGVPADPVVGLNASQIGSFFFDGHTGANDTTNVAAFGIAIASSAGPKAVGTDGTSTTYLPVSLDSNEVKLGAADTASSVIGTVKISATDNTVDISNQTVDISNQTVDVSGQEVTLGAAATAASVIGTVKISATDNTVDISNQTVDVSGQEVTLGAAATAASVIGTVKISATDNTIDISNQTVDVSGQEVTLGAATSPASVIGTVKIDGTTNEVSLASGSTVEVTGDVGIQGRTTGGLLMHSKLDYVNTPENVKASAGTVYGITVFNMTASPFYIKFYDETTSVNRATHTPVLRFAVPANASSSGAGFVFNVPQGLAFGNQIQYAITTGVADTDTNGISSGNAVVNIAYK